MLVLVDFMELISYFIIVDFVCILLLNMYFTCESTDLNVNTGQMLR